MLYGKRDNSVWCAVGGGAGLDDVSFGKGSMPGGGVIRLFRGGGMVIVLGAY